MSVEILKNPEKVQTSDLGPSEVPEIVEEEKNTIRKVDSNEEEDVSIDKANSPANATETPVATGTRVDRKGTPILKSTTRTMEEKKTRKHKVTFIDQIDKTQELSTAHYVLSYKKFNSMNTFDQYEYNENDGQSSQCCNIY